MLATTMTDRHRGFTLIELMITVAIIAILAAIALPAYQDSVWKGKRGEAKAAIMRVLQTEERFYTQNNFYQAYPPLPPGSAFPLFSGDGTANANYSMDAQPCPASTITQCVLVTATVIGGTDPRCGAWLRKDSKGSAASSATPDPICWR